MNPTDAQASAPSPIPDSYWVRASQLTGRRLLAYAALIGEADALGLRRRDRPPDGELVAEVSSEIYVWEGTLTGGTIPPYEGENVLSWQTAGSGWFGAGIMAMQPLNVFDFGEPVYNGYHTFTVEWQPGRIDWYVDGNLYHSATPADVAPKGNSKTISSWVAGPFTS